MVEPGRLLPALQGSTAFRTTHWSVVLQAGRREERRGAEALEKLCRAYWYPLYAFVRKRGYAPEDAKDLVQGFLTCLFERNDLANVLPAQGRFRSFLLTSLRHYLANEWDRSQTFKRGGGCPLVSVDASPAEELYCQEPVDPVTPETLFESRWARAVLDAALERLRCEQIAAEKGEQFEELKGFLAEKKAASRAEIALRHGISVNTVDVAIHRLRKRYGELLREEIALTVSRPEDIDDEIRHLIAVLGQEQSSR